MSTILLGGASGFIGFHLAQSLSADGHRVIPLTRHGSSSPHSVAWDPAGGRVDAGALAQAQPDIVVNLAGEPIPHRWTPRRRQRIRESRVKGTAALAAALAGLSRPPAVFVSGSAIGIYGAHRGDEVLDERSSPGNDFLGEVAQAWERATEPAERAGIRVVHSRTGIVLQRGGGVLARMLPLFRLGLGGRLGDGRQWMSWITMEDMVRALRFLAERSTLAGAVNLVAPDPATNAVFTRTLARVLRRPAVLPVPRLALEIVFGTMADNTVLASQRVWPERLAGAGFEFRHPRLEEGLRAAVTR